MSLNKEEILQVPPSLIEPNPYQPRKNFDQKELEGLMDSIKKFGVLQPLLVIETPEGKYQLIAGERRLRASQLLGLAKVPVIVREEGKKQQLEISLIENIQRENLNPLERAMAYKRLIEEFSLGHQEIAERLGKARPTISNALRLLGLPEEIKKALVEGKITESHCQIILSYKTESEQKTLFYKIIETNIPVRKVLREIQEERRAFHLEPFSKPNIFTTPVTKSLKDIDLKEKEEKLRESLGTRVEIDKKGVGDGKIVIDFYSEEELMNIIEKICS